MTPRESKPMHNPEVTNVLIAGLGGQGVLTASEILAQASLRAGYDVKKSEVKGMSQRGGSVMSDVRFGERVLSPMVPTGQADYLVLLETTQIDAHRYCLSAEGQMITPQDVADCPLPNRKSLNLALLGRLSASLAIPEECWLEALRAAFDDKLFETNRAAFLAGRT